MLFTDLVIESVHPFVVTTISFTTCVVALPAKV